VYHSLDREVFGRGWLSSRCAAHP